MMEKVDIAQRLAELTKLANMPFDSAANQRQTQLLEEINTMLMPELYVALIESPWEDGVEYAVLRNPDRK